MILFTEFLSVGIGDDRNMAVARLRQPQLLLQIDLASGGIQQVGAAHHVGDPLVSIVHHDGQLVGVESVFAQQSEVGEVVCERVVLLTLELVLKCYVGTRLDSQTQGTGEGNVILARRAAASAAATRPLRLAGTVAANQDAFSCQPLRRNQSPRIDVLMKISS